MATASGSAAAPQVRVAERADLAQIDGIYNHYVRETHITFDLEPMSVTAREEWFSHYAATGPHRLLVAVAEGNVVGFTCSSRYRPKPAYETSVETTIYVAPDGTGRGIGTALYTALFRELAAEDVHRAYGGIAIPNPASIALHERFGFKQVSYYAEQGRKFGRYWDVAWYEKPLG